MLPDLFKHYNQVAAKTDDKLIQRNSLFMSHISNVGMTIEKKKSEQSLDSFFKDEHWTTFEQNHLAELKKKDNFVLGGRDPTNPNFDPEEHDPFRESLAQHDFVVVNQTEPIDNMQDTSSDDFGRGRVFSDDLVVQNTSDDEKKERDGSAGKDDDPWNQFNDYSPAEISTEGNMRVEGSAEGDPKKDLPKNGIEEEEVLVVHTNAELTKDTPL